MNPLGGIGRGSSIPNWTIPYIIANSYEFVEAILPKHQAFTSQKIGRRDNKKITDYRKAKIIKRQKEIIKIGS